MGDPALGAAIAVAIAIHNIPEGVCVAMPIYYATGSRLKAFAWATLSGVSEPIGALFGSALTPLTPHPSPLTPHCLSLRPRRRALQ